MPRVLHILLHKSILQQKYLSRFNAMPLSINAQRKSFLSEGEKDKKMEQSFVTFYSSILFQIKWTQTILGQSFVTLCSQNILLQKVLSHL